MEVPFLPAVKRLLAYRSPDYKLNAHNVASPYVQGLKTPRRSSFRGNHRNLARDDESGIHDGSSLDEDINTAGPAHKLQKTPQYFSPGRRLFVDDSSSSMVTSQQREELTEISSKLKNRLLLALGRIQRDKVTSLKVISDISLLLPRSLWPQASNVNLGEGLPIQLQTPRDRSSPNYRNSLVQNLGRALDFSEPIGGHTASPPPKGPPPLAPGQTPDQLPTKNSPSAKTAARAAAAQALLNSPHLFSERVNIPTPDDEETSAQSALMAALQRQKRRSRSSFSSSRSSVTRSLVAGGNQLLELPMSLNSHQNSLPNSQSQTYGGGNPSMNSFKTLISKAPLQNLAAAAQISPQRNSGMQNENQNQNQTPPPSSLIPLKLPPINVALNELKGGEEDAVLSLMSLSSPQKVQFNGSRGHSRNTSMNSTGNLSVGSPSHQTVLPSISGLIRRYSSNTNPDNDETDIENDETDDE